MSDSTTTNARRTLLKRILAASLVTLAIGGGAVWLGTRRPPIRLTQFQCKGERVTQKVLVAYATRAGSTGEIAEAIGKRLCEEGFEVDVREVGGVAAIDRYDAVVLGSAIRYGKWLPELLAFLSQHKTALTKRPLAYFTACNKARDQSTTALAEMKSYAAAARAIVTAGKEIVLAGKIDLATLSFFDRLVVKMIGSQPGDFRDWNAIDAWAMSLTPFLRATK